MKPRRRRPESPAAPPLPSPSRPIRLPPCFSVGVWTLAACALAAMGMPGPPAATAGPGAGTGGEIVTGDRDPAEEEGVSVDWQDRGDTAWEARARRTASGGVEVVPERLEEAVEAYSEALEQSPEDPGLRAKLLGARTFQGEHVVRGGGAGEGAVREHVTRTRDLAQEGIGKLMRTVGGKDRWEGMEAAARARELVERSGHDPTELAGLLFESAVAWGRWGDTVGKIEAATQGVAGRLRRLARTALELDATVSDAGPHRFLGRLHAEAPKIPLITGWVDRDLAIEHLSRAVEIAPEAPENGLFLAEAILEHRPRWRRRALRWLEDLAGREPRPGELLADHRALERAREVLDEETGGEGDAGGD